MKENPLFVDSTKTRGDNVKTVFELNRLLLRDDERLIIKIVEEPQGRQHEVLMRREEEAYTARVFLQHQNKLRFQFVILRDTQVVFTSLIHEDRVNYLIELDWQPSWERKLLFEKRHVVENKSHKHYQQFQENKTLLGNLIKQWGL